MNKKNVLLLAAMCIVLSIAGGCQKSTYQLQILYDKQPVKTFTLQEIHAMPKESIMVAGSSYSGPSVETLLKYAGIQQFAKVSVMNEDFELIDLSAEQNMQNFIIDVINRGKFRLISKNIAKKDWMVKVTTLAVSSIP